MSHLTPRAIRIVGLFVILATLYGCKKKDPFTITEAEIITEMIDNKSYDQLISYGKQIGVEADSAASSSKAIYKYLEEMGYGHKPENIRYIEKEKMADTAAIRRAAWMLADGMDVQKVMDELEPRYEAYKQLKTHYTRLTEAGHADSAQIVAKALNAYRWIHRQARGSERLVLVNIRGAYLKGMDSLGKETLTMNVIVGKSDSPTPGLDTYATNVITYPYWNVPKSIALGEMLPRIRENIYYLERNGIEVLDRKGQVVDEHQIDWNEIEEGNFPYRFRQETGEDNSLGLMKVNIQNPYAIYLHDTNVRTLFDSKERWRSHGCIRLEQPAQLANFLAGEQILEDTFIEDAIAEPEKERKPTTLPFDKKVPVFIYYLPADIVAGGKLAYFEDVYDWEKGTI